MPSEATSAFGLPIELVSVLISAVTGFASGLLGYNYQRWLQRRGRVTARVESWHFGMAKHPEFDVKTDTYASGKVSEVSKADWASFDLEILIRNSKGIAIEVREPRLIFGKRRTDIVKADVEGPLIVGQNPRLSERHDMRLTVIPGEQSKILELNGTISKGEGLTKLPTCDRVDFVATYGKGKTLRCRVALLKIKH